MQHSKVTNGNKCMLAVDVKMDGSAMKHPQICCMHLGTNVLLQKFRDTYGRQRTEDDMCTTCWKDGQHLQKSTCTARVPDSRQQPNAACCVQRGVAVMYRQSRACWSRACKAAICDGFQWLFTDCLHRAFSPRKSRLLRRITTEDAELLLLLQVA